MGGIGQLRQQVAIETLPDDVLLKIFKSFIDSMELHGSASDEWHSLVHVCQRWRYLAFTSPRHLNLQVLCKLPTRSVKAMLDIWPELPFCIYAVGGFPRNAERGDCITALSLSHRVSGIRLENTSDSAWELFLSLMQRPFPALTHLSVRPNYSIKNATKNSICRSFLGGSAPSLRVLRLVWAPFPALPELLLSAANLVRLWYDDVPRSGYISPQAMVTGLSGLTRLESFSLTFPSPHSLPERPIRITPPHTRTLIPALTDLRFRGDANYMEDLVSQIDTPLLKSMMITLCYQEGLEVSQLAQFVRRADKLSSVDRAEVTFESRSISVKLSQELLEERIDPKTLRLYPSCSEPYLRLSYLAQFCASCLPNLALFESLHICVSLYYRWEEIIVDPDPQWLELLRLFNPAKKLYLSKYVVSRVAQALRGLPAERVMDVLPALEKVVILRLEHLEPVREAIYKFADARRLSGHPVLIDDWKGGVYYGRS